MEPRTYEFSDFRLDCLKRSLHKSGTPVRLTGKEFDVLRVLVQCAPNPVEKDAIIARAWPGQRSVDDQTVRQHVASLRRKLGNSIIGTIPQRGYYLAVELSEPEPGRPKAAIIAVGAALVALAACVMLLPQGRRAPPRSLPAGRIFAASTSEGRKPLVIPVPHRPDNMALSPAGDYLYLTADFGRNLTILRTSDLTIRELRLPRPAGTMNVTPSGRLYVASLVDGVMEIQSGADPRVVREFPTGGRVLDLEFDPATNDLLLAMERKGAKRLSLSSGKLTRITDRSCPVSVAMEHSGSRYYVMYQCSGPEGRNGHDAVEVFDSRRDRSLAVIAGPPMVGGRPAISPDDLTVLLDGGDACTSPEYDHEGCRISPGSVTHVLDSRALHVVATLGFPFGMAGPAQVDNRRFLILGESVEVIDAQTHSVLERIPSPGPYRNTAGHAVFSPDGKRLWMNLVAVNGRPENENENAVAVLDIDGAGCRDDSPKPAIFLPGDGVAADATGSVEFQSSGISFQPGRIGQAFYFDGQASLAAEWTGIYQFSRFDYSIAMFAKPAGDGEMPLIDWVNLPADKGIRLWRTQTGEVEFRAWPGEHGLRSKSQIQVGDWRHIAVTRKDRRYSLYLDGRLEDAAAFDAPFHGSVEKPLRIGSTQAGALSWNGLLDEVGFYDQALDARQIERIAKVAPGSSCN
jgi:DNA-binding winged helix-turn-helix (wHTH) protein/DNA-binding beta-propeller fold protein YncE